MARACTDAAIRGLESDVAALESYRDVIEQRANDWINDAFAFDTGQLSDPFDMAQETANTMTTTNLGCDEDQVPQVQDYIQDCLNKIRGEVNKKIKNIEFDSAGLAQTMAALAERFLCASLADLIAFLNKYSLNRLLDAINRNMTCITSSGDSAKYAADIDDMNMRIDQVIDDLPIDESGNFDFDKLTTGLDSGLKDNLEIFKNQNDTMITNSRKNMQDKLEGIGDFNPASRF